MKCPKYVKLIGRSMIVFVLLVIFLALGLTNGYGQTRIYVKKSAPSGGNGTSWATAYNDLQVALTAAVSMEGYKEIWVSHGEYKPTTGMDKTLSFNLPANTKIFGGFSGVETNFSDRNHRLNRTILSGDLGQLFEKADNSYHVVRAENVDANTVLDGFVIKEGNALEAQYGGGGIMLISTSNNTTNPVISNCEINDNHAVQGGGVINVAYNGHVSPKFISVSFKNNYASNAGGAVATYGGNFNKTPEFINCTFINNKGEQSGGAIANMGIGAIILNCTFTGNTTNIIGAALFNSSSTDTTIIRNSIFWKDFLVHNSQVIPNEIENHAFSSNQPSIIIVKDNIIQGGYGLVEDNNIDKDPMLIRMPGITSNPRSSIIPVTGLDKKYENVMNLSGPLMPGSWAYSVYRDHEFNKLYMIGMRLQVIDFNNITNGKPTSVLYSNALWGRTQNLAKALYHDKIYFGTGYSGLFRLNRATGEHLIYDPLIGEGLSHTSTKVQDVVIDTADNLLYAPVFYYPEDKLYGLLELNLVTNEKRWIKTDSSPVAIPQTNPNSDDESYWAGHKLMLDDATGILYYSMGNGVWWWDRNTNQTGVYNTEGGIPLKAGYPQLPSNLATTMFIDVNENKFYIGTHAGLFVWNRNDNTSRIYNTQNSKLIHNLINKVDKNVQDNILYVACELGGLFTINTQTGDQQLYLKDTGPTFPQLPETNTGSVTFDNAGRKLYVTGDVPNGGVWVLDYNNMVPDDGDLRLKDNSPAIDFGDDTALPSDVTTDIIGFDRKIDYPSLNGSRSIDAGAYEKFIDCPPITAANFSFEKSNNIFTFTPTANETSAACHITYKWAFGDGQNSTVASPSHVYSNKGEFVVSLILTYKCNDCPSVTDTVTQVLTIHGLCEGIYCNENGGLSIGASLGATGYRLSVQGKMIIEGATVSLLSRWPDYVFEPGYMLMPLPQLKEYVKINQHLPGIPGAAEIKNNGIDAGPMTTLLVQKTEELALYFIALNERLKKLESKSAKQSQDSTTESVEK